MSAMRLGWLVLALALLCCASASAATRYAEPGGDGPSPCNVKNPCSIYTAADTSGTAASGDEVILLAGEYEVSEGGFGPGNFVSLEPGIHVKGAVGSRPRILADAGSVPLIVSAGATVSHLEIEATTSTVAISVSDGTVEDVVAIANPNFATACSQTRGLIRDSVCIARGSFSTAVGVGFMGAGSFTPVLRNVTAIATGPSSNGASYTYSGGASATITAKAVLAQGTGKDVRAGATGGGSANFTLQYSNFDTTELTATGSVSAAGSATNVIAAPLLAADGYHQLPGSPTVDVGGPVDATTGKADIDGQQRTIDLVPDIGADELGHQTSTAVDCGSPTVPPSASTTCTATVTDASPGFVLVGGTVSFSTPTGGSFSPPSCSPTPPAFAPVSTCQVTFLPSQMGSFTQPVLAAYSGDGTHDASAAATSIAVVVPTGGGSGGGGPAGPSAVVPDTALTAKPAKRTRKRQAKFTFTADQTSSSFECKLDKRPFQPCVSPFKKTVGVGGHRFQVRAVTAAGPDPTPADYSWRVLPKKRKATR